ncbi:MAG: PKD domain-containing protein [Candidatus Bathyarchaeia archaeon]
MRKKRLFSIFFIVSLVFSMITFNMALAEAATLYVNPPTITIYEFDTFNINISVSEVVDLHSFDFKLAYNASLLDSIQVVRGDFVPYNTFFQSWINDTIGTIRIAASTPEGFAPTMNGSGTIATITFNCTGPGECALDLQDTTLLNSTAQAITAPPYLGDATGDLKVNIFDVVHVLQAYGSTPGEPYYDPTHDFDNDGYIGLIDLQTAAMNFAKDYNQTSEALKPVNNTIPHSHVDGYVTQQELPPPHGPTADFSAIPAYPYAHETILFDATNSSPGWTGREVAPIVSYAWDLETDGTVDFIGSFPVVTYSYASAGNYTVTLNVTDSQGFWDIESYVQHVLERPPPPPVDEVLAAGFAYLAASQNSTCGSWGSWPEVKPAYTGLALTALEKYAYQLGYESPFDPGYPYSGNVTAGWQFIFSLNQTGYPDHVLKQALSLQNHTAGTTGALDNPDTNGNGYGICFDGNPSYHQVYTTGIALMALQASGFPGRENDGGIDFDGDDHVDTFQQIAQDAVDWLAWAQGDQGLDEGGYSYEPLDNANESGWVDNSNSGYAYLGLAAAEAFECDVPNWVRAELDAWIANIQSPVDGDSDDGGSKYVPWDPWTNELRTGNLIFQMTFYGDALETQRLKDALDYVERHWQDANTDPGWGYSKWPSNYQAMFCLTKGLEYSAIDLIDLDSDNVTEHEWHDEFATVLSYQQNPLDGSWYTGYYGDAAIDTAWALLTLLKAAPPSIVHDIAVTHIATSKTGCLPVEVIGVGRNLHINVTVENQGNTTEDFTVTVYANNTQVGSQPVTLSFAETIVLAFALNTMNFEKGNYVISASAEIILGEADTFDNSVTYGSTFLSLSGDVDGNRAVNIFDIVRMAGVYSVEYPDLQYSPNCDIDGDDDIDIFDIVLAAGNYGESW